MEHKTIVLRLCLDCGDSLGLGVWPWSGARFTVSHGLCRACFDRLEAAARDEEADSGARGPRAALTPAA